LPVDLHQHKLCSKRSYICRIADCQRINISVNSPPAQHHRLYVRGVVWRSDRCAKNRRQSSDDQDGPSSGHSVSLIPPPSLYHQSSLSGFDWQQDVNVYGVAPVRPLSVSLRRCVATSSICQSSSSSNICSTVHVYNMYIRLIGARMLFWRT